MLQIWHLGEGKKFYFIQFRFSLLPPPPTIKKTKDVLQGIRNYRSLHVYYNQHIHLINTHHHHMLLIENGAEIQNTGKWIYNLGGETNPVWQGWMEELLWAIPWSGGQPPSSPPPRAASGLILLPGATAKGSLSEGTPKAAPPLLNGFDWFQWPYLRAHEN